MGGLLMKRVLTFLFAFFVIFGINSYAVDFTVTNPMQEGSLTSSKSLVASGTVNNGTIVTITHYLVDRNNLDADKNPKADLIDFFEVKGDALNLFTAEILLLEGENRLDFSIYKGKNSNGKDEYQVITKSVNFSKDMQKEVKNIIKQIELKKQIISK